MAARDYLLGRRNRRRRGNLQRRIVYSDEGEVTAQEEVNKKKMGFRWRAKSFRNLKFVDDGIILSKIKFGLGRSGRQHWRKALQVQAGHAVSKCVQEGCGKRRNLEEW